MQFAFLVMMMVAGGGEQAGGGKAAGRGDGTQHRVCLRRHHVQLAVK